MKGFRIFFTSQKDVLTIRVDSKASDDAYLTLQATPGVFYAPVVAAHLARELREFIAEKVRIAYERGYSDGKGHKRKAKRFFGDFDLNPKTGAVIK